MSVCCKHYFVLLDESSVAFVLIPLTMFRDSLAQNYGICLQPFSLRSFNKLVFEAGLYFQPEVTRVKR